MIHPLRPASTGPVDTRCTVLRSCCHCRPDPVYIRCTVFRRSQHMFRQYIQCTQLLGHRLRPHDQKNRMRRMTSLVQHTDLFGSLRKQLRWHHLQSVQTCPADSLCRCHCFQFLHNNQPSSLRTHLQDQNRHRSCLAHSPDIEMPGKPVLPLRTGQAYM